jgi:hypothetical protein
MSLTEQPAQLVKRPGTQTDKSLTELLGVKDGDAASTELQRDLERIREAERTAERAAAAVRLC